MAERAEAQTEIDVFEVVLVGWCQKPRQPRSRNAARRISMQAAVTTWNGRDVLTAGWSARAPGIDVKRIAGEVEDDTGMLDRPVGEEQLAAHDGYSGELGVANERVEPARPGAIVSLFRKSRNSDGGEQLPRPRSCKRLRSLSWLSGDRAEPVRRTSQEHSVVESVEASSTTTSSSGVSGGDAEDGSRHASSAATLLCTG